MPNRADTELLLDIREAMERIAAYLGNVAYDDFMDDTKTQDAVIRNLEVIGEAAKGVSEQLRDDSPHIPWRSMAGMRDRLIHHYFGVNLDIVWEVAYGELPIVAAYLAGMED